MFIGHFGAAFGAKIITPKVSLGSLFLAAQFLDLLWPTFLLLGIEHVRIAPGATVVTPLLFEHYPFSHSLLAAIGWGAVIATAYWMLRRNRTGATVLGLLALSHWMLDAIVHQPDLPLFPGNSPLVGFNLWSSFPATLAIEVSIFLLGAWLYARATKPLDEYGKWGFRALLLFFLIIYAGNIFGTPPPDANIIAWVGELQWLFVVWGYWLDKHRQAVNH